MSNTTPTNENALILCVDDEPDLRELLQRQLMRLGYEVITASDGTRGLALTQERQPDLILLDVTMPGISGVEVLKALVERDPDAAVVMVSGQSGMQTAIECMTYGAYDYVTKPFEASELAHRVSAALEKRTLLIERRDYHANLEVKIAEATKNLEQRLRELTALNQMFQTYLRQRDENEEKFISLVDNLLMMPPEMKHLAQKMAAQRAEMQNLASQRTAF